MTRRGRLTGPVKEVVAETGALGDGIASGIGVASVVGAAAAGGAPVGRTVSESPHADIPARRRMSAKADKGRSQRCMGKF